MSVVKKTAADRAADTLKEKAEREVAAVAKREKAFKQAFDAGLDVEDFLHPQDLLEFAGEEYRVDAEKPDEAFKFDVKADGSVVDHISVAANVNGVLVEINGKYFRMDPQVALATSRLFSKAVVNLNH